jgi:hypothetical protein
MFQPRIIAPVLSLIVFAATARADVLYFTTGGQIERISGNGTVTPLVVGLGDSAGLAYNAITNDLYVAVGQPAVAPVTYVIDQVSLSGVVTPFVGGFSGQIAAMSFDSHGDLFVTQGSGTIDEISSAGNASTYVSGLGTAVGVVCDSGGNVYAATDSGNYIDSILPIHQFIEIFHTPGDVSGLTIDPANNLYASSLTDIYKFTTSGSGGVYATASTGDFGSLAYGSNGQLFAVNGDTVDDIVGGNVSPYATISGFVGEMVDVVPEPRMGIVFVLLVAGSLGMRRAHGR